MTERAGGVSRRASEAARRGRATRDLKADMRFRQYMAKQAPVVEAADSLLRPTRFLHEQYVREGIAGDREEISINDALHELGCAAAGIAKFSTIGENTRSRNDNAAFKRDVVVDTLKRGGSVVGKFGIYRLVL